MITITFDQQPREEIPSLDEMIDYYKEQGLLFAEDVIKDVATKIRDIPQSIPPSELEKQLALLTVWPLIERYNVMFESIGKDPTKDDKDKIEELTKKFKEFQESEDRRTLINRLSNYECSQVSFLNPYLMSRDWMTKIVLSVMCEPLERHVKSTPWSRTKIVHDAQMGGTLYIVGNDERIPVIHPAKYSFLQRSFICLNEKGEPVVFMDNIEGGEPFYKTLKHWRGYDELEKEIVFNNRVHHVYEGLASAMHLAERLGIRFVLPRDFELTELTKLLGARERAVFSKDQDYWKIGLHSKQSQSGVYAHTLYRGGKKNRDGNLQTRFRLITGFPFKTPSDMLGQLETIARIIIEPNIGRRNLVAQTDQRLDAMMSLYDVITNLPTTQPFIEDQAKKTVTTVYDAIGREIPERYKW